MIRINTPTTKLGAADRQGRRASGCDAVLLPKVESVKDVRDAHLRLAAAGAPDTIQIWCMIETPRGVLNIEEIAFSSPHLTCLVMGTSDLAKDLRARHTPDRQPVLVCAEPVRARRARRRPRHSRRRASRP